MRSSRCRVEALYDQPRALAADAEGAEGAEMAKLRKQMHQRMNHATACAHATDG